MDFDQLLKELGVNREETLARFGGLQALYEKFLKKFPGDPTYSQILQAAQDKEVQELERASHTLKGMAANLGLDELSRRCAVCINRLREGDTGKIDEDCAAIVEEYERINQHLKAYG